MKLLLDVWREASREGTLAEAAERIRERLAAEMPVAALVIRRFEAERRRLETLVVAGRAGGLREHARTELSAGQVEALLGRGRGGGAGLDVDVCVQAAGGDVRGDALVLPLMDGNELIGCAVALGGRGELQPHARRWAQLRDPLTAALRAELRRQEIERYRSALEADRQALLTRLDRQEISEAVVGARGGLRTVVDRVLQVAGTDVPVLLLGETGTGKEVIAREIHRHSPRAGGPVVRVNCGAIAPGLIDSELFGHERGSFTGAVSERAGWFERADGGTLFLDEIGELPVEAQVRLLRVLQDGTFERVGGRRTRTVDVRIVAATNRDLHAMVQAGAFREDLWYRVSVFPIRLPPLRERRDDIPALAEHFAWRAGKRLGGAPLVPTPADIQLLVDYPWPGNVRELAAVIERAAILGGGHRLEIGAALGVPTLAPAAQPDGRLAPAEPRLATLDQAMVRHIEAALHATGGRIEGDGGAAALLAVNPHTLRARMRKLGIDWERFRPQRVPPVMRRASSIPGRRAPLPPATSKSAV